MRSLIAENRIQQLDTSAGAEKERGRVQMDDAIYNLYMKSCITSGTAIAGAKRSGGYEEKGAPVLTGSPKSNQSLKCF